MRFDTSIIIQARMGSSRLPGKVLRPFYGQQTILDILLATLRRSVHGLPIILATSDAKPDDQLEEWANANEVNVFRGDENNVLARFLAAAETYNVANIVRICADNPFLDPELLDRMITVARAESNDYVSYLAGDDLPAMKSHWGIFAEWVTTDALRKTAASTTDKLYTEHVTNFVYGHPALFRLKWLKAPEMVYKRNDVRFTIDTEEDFELVRRIYAVLAERGIHPNFKDALQLVENDEPARQVMQNQIRNFTK
jgi:spore coat polysaccharide biosynthesis protein SpsF